MLGSVAEDASEPLLPLEVLASAENSISDDRAEVEAVIDTGFDGEITLPEATIRRLGYPYTGTASGILAEAARSSSTTTRVESSGTEWCAPWR
jgi:predicted aspartyl protease